MQVSDRDLFEALLEKLYAGFNMPMSKARSDAYFDGLQKMSLARFSRCVDEALGENGPERIPSVTQIWKIYKGIAHATEPLPVPKPIEQDHLLFFANRLFFKHLTFKNWMGSVGTFIPARGMVNCIPSAEMLASRKVIRDLVDYFSGPILEGDSDATPAEFVAQLIVALDRVSKIDARTIQAWGELVRHADAMKPFERHMVRPLEERYEKREIA